MQYEFVGFFDIDPMLSLAPKISTYIVFFLFGATCHAQVDIFVSTEIDGHAKWSTQAFDASYNKTSIVEAQPFPMAKGLSSTPSIAKPKLRPSNSQNLIVKTEQIQLQKLIVTISNKYGVDPELVEALIRDCPLEINHQV